MYARVQGQQGINTVGQPDKKRKTTFSRRHDYFPGKRNGAKHALRLYEAGRSAGRPISRSD
jgi:hypothetical protein